MGQCANPECECALFNVVLKEVEASVAPARRPITLSLEVDADSWEEKDARQREPFTRQLAQEFLQEYPQEARAHLKERIRQRRALSRRIKSYRYEPPMTEEDSAAVRDIGRVTLSLDEGRVEVDEEFAGTSEEAMRLIKSWRKSVGDRFADMHRRYDMMKRC